IDLTLIPCTDPTRGLSYGNAFLLPLIGGSGGGGVISGINSIYSGFGGGAGGGAIMIASSVLIRVNGFITANGGTPGGSGGAIRLVAPTITGFGTLQASGGQSGASGRIRIEALQKMLAGQSLGYARAATLLPAPNLLP